MPHTAKPSAATSPDSLEEKKQSPILLTSFIHTKTDKVPTFAFRYISLAGGWTGKDSFCKCLSNSSPWLERGLKPRKSP